MTPRKPAAKKAAPAKATTAKRAAPRKAAAKKAAPRTTPAKKAAAPPPPAQDSRQPGPVETSVLAELTGLQLHATGLGMSALKLARHVDEAASGGEAASAARELRMTFALARTLGNPLSPPVPQENTPDGKVVGSAVLEQMRAKSAHAQKTRTKSR